MVDCPYPSEILNHKCRNAFVAFMHAGTHEECVDVRTATAVDINNYIFLLTILTFGKNKDHSGVDTITKGCTNETLFFFFFLSPPTVWLGTGVSSVPSATQSPAYQTAPSSDINSGSP
ncbi:hypothetical protein V6N13_139764 [Hibiscus sabdariffa]|uniref:Uncharacterized protein n=2 Tax=Hibiscus sabdariffa TaxID=183260 RepID=A0ABR2C7J0_9ROSI